jgi:hypothetical protein
MRAAAASSEIPLVRFAMRLFRAPFLNPLRIWSAFVVAIAADGAQVLLGPLGWTFFDEIIDVVAAIVLSLLLGFHPLLLPTLVTELIPVVDMLPTWTGCVAAVVVLRRRKQRAIARPSASTPPEVIDV